MYKRLWKNIAIVETLMAYISRCIACETFLFESVSYQQISVQTILKYENES